MAGMLSCKQWDTAGQERYKAINSSYYKGKFCQVRIDAHGTMIVYDIMCRDSFFAVDEWMKELEKNYPEYTVKMLIGNKCDLETERKVTYEEGKEMASKYGMSLLETSAKTTYNVDKAFMLILW